MSWNCSHNDKGCADCRAQSFKEAQARLPNAWFILHTDKGLEIKQLKVKIEHKWFGPAEWRAIDCICPEYHGDKCEHLTDFFAEKSEPNDFCMDGFGHSYGFEDKEKTIIYAMKTKLRWLETAKEAFEKARQKMVDITELKISEG